MGVHINDDDDDNVINDFSGRSVPLSMSSSLPSSSHSTGRLHGGRHRQIRRRSHRNSSYRRDGSNDHGRHRLLRRHRSADGMDMIMATAGGDDDDDGDFDTSSRRSRRIVTGGRQRDSLSSSLSFRRPSTRRTTSDDNIRIVREEFTVDKLRLSLLDIYGRTKEEDILNDIISRVAASASASALTDQQSDSDVVVAVESTKEPTVRNLEEKEFVLISGESGTGKTALALSIKRRVKRMRGAFVSGKFDNNIGGLGRVDHSSSTFDHNGSHETTEERQQPYRPILTACSELCCQLLAMKYSSPPNSFHPVDMKNTTTSMNNSDKDNRLGEDTETTWTPSTFGFDNKDDWKDLLKIIPDLGAVVGPEASKDDDDDDTKSDKNEFPQKSEGHDGNVGEMNGSTLQGSKLRFHYLLRKFFRSVATFLEGPLVFVLDDMQWADFASLDLLEGLLSDNGVATTSPSVSSSSVTTTATATTNTSRCNSGLLNTPGHRSQRVLQKNGCSSKNNIIVIGLYR